MNEKCVEFVQYKRVPGFLEPYRRMTCRCEDVVSAMALNMNCESACKVCKIMGIPVSGDTIIRMLLRRYHQISEERCSEVTGVDDWAIRKRHTYGTIICDGQTHKPIKLLPDRDGEALKKWLQENKHIKIVTSDRATAYAKAISEALPDVIQIVDRFHLSSNLMEAVKACIHTQLPLKILVSEESVPAEEQDKKKEIDGTSNGKRSKTKRKN